MREQEEGTLMQVEITTEAYKAMLTAALQAAPLEACGLCAGHDTTIERFYELTNADASSEHFTMLPEEQFAAVKDMRTHGTKLLAIWHSHPETPARLSLEDLRLAFMPDTIYLILSLAQKDHPDLKGFTVENGQPQPVEVTIT